MAAVVTGPRTWSGGRDKEGEYTYKITWLVEADVTDGPGTILAAPGLPQPGDPWSFEPGGADPIVECGQESSATPLSQKDGEPFCQWLVEQTFSSKVDNPFVRPPEVSGGYHKEKEEATEDRFGRAIVNSAWEPIRGPKVEFDTQRDTIKIKQWLLDPQEELVDLMMNTVNGFPMWAKNVRTVKLTNRTFEKHNIGREGTNFYTRTLEFIYKKKGWDRDLLDEGTKVLFGEWDATAGEWKRKPIGGGVLNPDATGVHDPDLPLNPDPNNPAHFIKWTGGKGNSSRVILDGRGMPYEGAKDIRIYTCPRCLKGAPKVWNLQGMDLGYEIPLTYTSGCTWESLDTPDGKFSLSYFDDENIWELSNTIMVDTWSVDANVWECLTVNTLKILNVQSELPLYVTVEPAYMPGMIHVEKYDESDFALLGIPVVL